RILKLLADASGAGRLRGAAPVLCPGDHIDPDVRREPLGVPLGVGHHQRSAGLPSFAVAVDLDHSGAGMGPRAADQDPVAAIAYRIKGGRVGEGELISGEGMVLVLPREAAGLRKLHVERCLSGAGDDRKNSVEDLAMENVPVESLVHQIFEVSPALGNSVAEYISEPLPVLAFRIAAVAVAQE